MRTRTQSGDDVSRAPIRPELVAAKLAAIRNYEFPEIQRQIEERPGLVELLWFVQAASLRPGGLAKFAEEILAEFPERLGTATMRKAAGLEYSLEEKIAIWKEMPDGSRPYVEQESGPWHDPFTTVSLNCRPQDRAALEARNQVKLEAALKDISAGTLRDKCSEAALAALPGYLFALCTFKGQGFDPQGSGSNQVKVSEVVAEALAKSLDGEGSQPDWREWCLAGTWFFEDVIGALLEMKERRASHAQKPLALTVIVKLVFDALDFALAEKKMVQIVGESRFGKTEALQAWCDMRPGLARLVRVPCDNSMGSFLRRIGEAFGISCSYGSSSSHLKERVEYVIEHSGLFLVLDEGAFLLPQNYNAGTAPTRLNWVRTEIVDRNLPLAIAVTPQSFGPALDRFVKKTRYSSEQFLGRLFLTRQLPAALSEADMIAVAQVHFPEMDEDVLGYIANEARLSQNYLQAVEAIARLARWKATKANRRLGLKDLKAAVAEVLSRAAPATGGTSRPTIAADDAAVHTRVSGLVNAPLTGASRGVKPAVGKAAPAIDLSDRSLRGAGRDKVETALISADT